MLPSVWGVARPGCLCVVAGSQVHLVPGSTSPGVVTLEFGRSVFCSQFSLFVISRSQTVTEKLHNSQTVDFRAYCKL